MWDNMWLIIVMDVYTEIMYHILRGGAFFEFMYV